MVEDGTLQGIREEFHIYKVPGIVVGILVTIGIVQLLHELCRSIADGEGNRLVTGAFYLCQGVFQGQVRGIALGRGGQIDGGLGQRDTAFRHANLGHHLEAGIGQKQSIGIGQAYVFRGAQTQATGNEEGIFAAVNHARQVVNGRIGV